MRRCSWCCAVTLFKLALLMSRSTIGARPGPAAPEFSPAQNQAYQAASLVGPNVDFFPENLQAFFELDRRPYRDHVFGTGVELLSLRVNHLRMRFSTPPLTL